jgi:hypothetical protein
MNITSPNSTHLFSNKTNLLTVYNRIKLRNIVCMVLLGEPLVGFSFADI